MMLPFVQLGLCDLDALCAQNLARDVEDAKRGRWRYAWGEKVALRFRWHALKLYAEYGGRSGWVWGTRPDLNRAMRMHGLLTALGYEPVNKPCRFQQDNVV